jgi:hypothetical protein
MFSQFVGPPPALPHLPAAFGGLNARRTKAASAERDATVAGHKEITESWQHRGPLASQARARPNPSLKRSANGRPPGPGLWSSVHFHRPGPGGLPSSPA